MPRPSASIPADRPYAGEGLVRSSDGWRLRGVLARAVDQSRWIRRVDRKNALRGVQAPEGHPAPRLADLADVQHRAVAEAAAQDPRTPTGIPVSGVVGRPSYSASNVSQQPNARQRLVNAWNLGSLFLTDASRTLRSVPEPSSPRSDGVA